MLSEAQRRVLEIAAERGERWFPATERSAIRALERKTFVTAERLWRFGGWQYLVRITDKGRRALEE